MNKLKDLLSKAFGFLSSDKGQAAIHQAVDLIPRALPIVQTIAALTPNRADDEIAQAFAQYAKPFSAEYTAMGSGRALMHLASSLLADQMPGTATKVLDAAVQLAVTGGK